MDARPAGPARRRARARGWVFGLVGAMAAAGLLAVACGTQTGSTFTYVADASTTPIAEASVPVFDGLFPTESSVPTGSLNVQPQNDVIDVPPSTTVQFHAYIGSSTTPVTATWSVDQQALGTIDNTGLFTPSGAAG